MDTNHRTKSHCRVTYEVIKYGTVTSLHDVIFKTLIQQPFGVLLNSLCMWRSILDRGISFCYCTIKRYLADTVTILMTVDIFLVQSSNVLIIRDHILSACSSL